MAVVIPTSSLVVDHAGMHVVAVDAHHQVHFLPVTIGKDIAHRSRFWRDCAGQKIWLRARAIC